MTDEEKAAAEAKATEEKAVADKAATDKAAAERKRRGTADPNEGKVVLTPEELDAKLEQARKDAVDAANRKVEAQRQKEKEDSEAEAARQRGEWEKVAKDKEAKLAASQTEVTNLRMMNRRNEVKEQVRQYLADHHADYVGAERWILPVLEFSLETQPEDITKRIKAASDDYVKSNPRTRPASPPPPPGGRHASAASDRSNKEQTNGAPRRITGVASRF